MNFIKRGFASVLRKPGKSLILLVLVFVLGNIIAGAISVKKAIANTQKVISDKVGIEARVVLDTDKYIKEGGSKEGLLKMQSLNAANVETIGQSQYVKYYDYLTNIWLEGIGIASYIDPKAASIPGKGGDNGEEIQSSFRLLGGQNPNILDIQQGKATLYQGRVFTAEEVKSNSNVALISKNLAEKNGLAVGSTIKLKRDIYKYDNRENAKAAMPEIAKTLKYEVTVIGIFEPKKNVAVDGNGQLQVITGEHENTIYTTNATINSYNEEITKADKEVNKTSMSYNFNNITPIFALKDPNELQAFKDETTPKLPQYYMLTDNSKEFNKVSAPMANMDWISGIVLYVAMGATILILSLLITLFLRDRRHEMGIYLSLGERKIKVAAQVLIEVMAIAIIAVSLSLVSGNVLAKNMSSRMLQNQITAEQEKSANDVSGKGDIYDPEGNSVSMSSQELMDSYRVALDMNTILIIFLVGTGTAFVSTMAPIVYTLRLNPKKILM
jgi:putative ABC transport system permease protein